MFAAIRCSLARVTTESGSGVVHIPKTLSCEVSHFTAAPLNGCFEIGRHPKNGKWARKGVESSEFRVREPLGLEGFLEVLKNETLLKNVRYAVDLDRKLFISSAEATATFRSTS